MYELCQLLPASYENMENQRQAILVTVSTFLKDLETTGVHGKETELETCLQYIKQCRKIVEEMKNEELAEETSTICFQLEVACLCYLHSPVLSERITEILNTPPKPFPFYLDLYYLLDQLKIDNTGIKKDCLRTALNTQLQSSFSIDRIQETIHGLVDISDSKQDVYHWVEQLLQITKSQGSGIAYSKE